MPSLYSRQSAYIASFTAYIKAKSLSFIVKVVTVSYLFAYQLTTLPHNFII